MRIPRSLRGALAAFALSVLAPVGLAAQGTTTGAISGVVSNPEGAGVEGVQVTAVNRATGATATAISREGGRYFITGLEVGGPYTLSARRIGYTAVTRDGLRVSLGQTLRSDFVLAPQAEQLSAVTVTATAENSVISASHTGVGTQISDSAIARLPSLNRDFTDFAKLAPQVSTAGNGLSGGGVNNRFNNIQIDGASNADLFGLSSTPTPGGLSNAKSITIEAVKEYQVLLSPFDVRQGNFTGLLINAVTKSGTNDFDGSLFGFFRDQSLSRSQDYLNDFRQTQFGGSIGGPIVKDKIFFFFAGELQRQQQPSSGPSISSSDSPVTQAQIDAFNASLENYGGNGGTGAAVDKKNPNTNLFGRLDFNLPYSSRLVLRHNYVSADNDVFFRDVSTTATPTFPLTTNLYAITNKTNSTVGQLYTNWMNGASNELLLSYQTIEDARSTPVISPQITITVPQADGTGSALLRAGTEASSHGNELSQRIIEVTDNFSFPLGAHLLTVGTRNQFYRPDNLFAQNRYGTWSFASQADFDLGRPTQYQVAIPVGGSGRAQFNAATYGGYVQDQWQTTPNLSITAGLRADIPSMDTPKRNEAFETQFAGTGLAGRRTDKVPTGQVQWSPRVGFNWDVTGDRRNQLRGGIGVFNGPPAYVWLSNAFGNTGVYGYASLTCGNLTATTANAPPTFSTATAVNPPQTCDRMTAGVRTPGGGAGAALGGAINLIRDDFRFPQDVKASLGFDREIFDGYIVTIEGLYSHAMYAPFYENIALAGPNSTLFPTTLPKTDRNGRVLYGGVTATAANPVYVVPARTQIYDLTNSDKDYSYNITGGIQRTFRDNFEGSLFYTYSQARDVQSTLNSTANSNFNQGRDVAGDITRHDLARSKWEQPHRIVASGTYAFPTKTDVSFIYNGAIGAPFDYTYTGVSGSLGDLNADGRAGNDLVYIPTDVTNIEEIAFSATANATIAQQQTALDEFIEAHECLDRQRGRIMGRNTCRSEWQHTVNVSVRQSLPYLPSIRSIGTQNLSVQLDIFNFTNLLNKKWGLEKRSVEPGLPGVFLLSRTGGRTDALGRQQGVFTFSPTTTFFNADRAESNYRMQLSARYSF
jgi:outer membrane receptor protein involved in Fe transport